MPNTVPIQFFVVQCRLSFTLQLFLCKELREYDEVIVIVMRLMQGCN